MQKRTLIAVVVLFGTGALTGTLMSQATRKGTPEEGGLFLKGPETDPAVDGEDAFLGRSAPAEPLRKGQKPQGAVIWNAQNPQDAIIEQQVRHLHGALSRQQQPTQRDVELKKAIVRYLADTKLSRAAAILEEAIAEAPGTPEAEKAASALHFLKGQDIAPAGEAKAADDQQLPTIHEELPTRRD